MEDRCATMKRDPLKVSLTRPRNRFPEVLPFLETLDGVI